MVTSGWLIVLYPLAHRWATQSAPGHTVQLRDAADDGRGGAEVKCTGRPLTKPTSGRASSRSTARASAAGREQVVGVQLDHVVALDRVEALVDRRDVAAVLLVSDDPHARVAGDLLADGGGVVGRRVIDHQHVDVHPVLAQHAGHRVRQEPGVVVGRDQDGHPGGPGAGRARGGAGALHARQCRARS